MPLRRLLWLVLLLATATISPAATLHIQGDRITLLATNEPLQDLLKEFAQQGITVKIDPSINKTVSGNYRNKDLDKVLRRLLGEYDYALFWENLSTPLGPLATLKQIDIFRQGQAQNIGQTFPRETKFVVIRPAKGQPYVAQELLIAFRPGTTASDLQKLLTTTGATVIDCLPALGAYRLRLPPGTNIPELANKLAKDPTFHAAEPNYVIEIPPTNPSATDKSGAIRVASSATSGRPALAILDSGLNSLPELSAAVVARYNALNPDGQICDPVGHGTQMAMIGAGTVAPQGIPTEYTQQSVPIVAIQAFDEKGCASNFGLMRSIKYASDQGSKVINLSWGSEQNSEFLRNAVAYAQNQGIIVVAAAGNEPTGKNIYPAAYSGVIAVSATTANGKAWPSSNYGSFVTLAAPGEATIPVGTKPGNYAGTSIASAFVARSLTLYLDNHPQATAQNAVQALMTNLSPAPGNQYGKGTLDAAAVNRFLR